MLNNKLNNITLQIYTLYINIANKYTIMRQIKYIFIHCTATQSDKTIKDIRAIFERNGWRVGGYHYVISSDGTVYNEVAEDKISNGVRGYNAIAINVAYIGGVTRYGLNKDTRTEAQKTALRRLLLILRTKYPYAIIMGHRDIWGRHPNKWHKLCPCFDAMSEYSDILPMLT